MQQERVPFIPHADVVSRWIQPVVSCTHVQFDLAFFAHKSTRNPPIVDPYRHVTLSFVSLSSCHLAVRTILLWVPEILGSQSMLISRGAPTDRKLFCLNVYRAPRCASSLGCMFQWLGRGTLCFMSWCKSRHPGTACKIIPASARTFIGWSPNYLDVLDVMFMSV